MMASQEGVRFFLPGLPETVTDEEIQLAFSKFGQLIEATAAKDKSQVARGFGYVAFAHGVDPNAVLNEIHLLGGTEVRAIMTKESIAAAGASTRKVHLNDCPHLSTDQLRDALSVFGQVWDVHTPKDANTGERKRFAFVTFGSDDSYQKAVAAGSITIEGTIVPVKPSAQTDTTKGCGKGMGCGGWGGDMWGAWDNGWGAGKGWGDAWGAGKGDKGKGKGPGSGKPAGDGMTYFASNLAPHLLDQDLTAYFTKFGKVVNATVLRDRDTQKSRGIGYVTMENGDARDLILTERHEIGGQLFSVMLSKDNLGGENSHKVHIDHCDAFSAETLREAMSMFGPVLDVHTPKDAMTGERKRFGFVTFSTEEAMNSAIAHGTLLIGESQVPIKAASRNEKGGGFGGFGKGDKGGCWGPSKGCKGGKGDWYGQDAWGADPSWGKGFGGFGGDSWGKGGKVGGFGGFGGDAWGKGCGKDSWGGKDAWGGKGGFDGGKGAAWGGDKGCWGGKGMGKMDKGCGFGGFGRPGPY